MHNYRLISLLNSIGLAAARTARNAVGVLFLVFCIGASADCSDGIFPSAASAWLLPTAEKRLEFGEYINASPAACEYTNIELAQWYFWGEGSQGAYNRGVDLERAYRYATQALSANHWPYELALMHAAFVIKGMDTGLSLEEAVRRYRREILSGNPLRRDKALAMLNQLSSFLPRVITAPNAVFADSRLTEPLAQGPILAVQLSQDGKKTLILAADTDGAPRLLWANAVADADKSISLTFQRRASLGASGAEDVRQQLWRLPTSMPRSGILLSRFTQADGSYYESRCTATQLASQWLISASHCLFTPAGDGHLRSLQFIADPTAFSGSDGAAKRVSAVWHHRQHHPENQHNGELGRYSGSDIALFKLATPIPLQTPPMLATPNSQNPWVENLAYPNDKPRYTLWSSRCRSSLWQRGTQKLADLYVLDCFSYAGESGAVLTQNNDSQRQIIGVLSARISNDSINQPVFAALTHALIKEIKTVMAGEHSALFVAMPIMSPVNLAAAKP
ncbi:trypsin-like serine peptidase [Zhongshania sp.]|jgi:V8-like Glu-specific endopeptidase|uniref:trypsin-like serine peptidase n=1 Tax=Zhongshania sp. TaxID=1971902 RepID=UPI0039E4D4CE